MSLVAAGKAVAQDDSLLFGVNEGVSEQQNFSELQEKYKGLAEVMSKALKRPVKVEASTNIGSSANSLKKERYDIMFSRPSNVAGKAIRDNHYQLVASAKNELTAKFIVNKSSPLKSAADVKDKKFVMPEKNALMTKVALATLRDMKMTPLPQNVHNARLQETVASMVESKFGDVGVVSPLISKDWEKNGGLVLFQSKKLPSWAVIAAPSLPQDDVAKIRTALVDLESTESGKQILQKINVKGFAPGNQADYVALVNWLGE